MRTARVVGLSPDGKSLVIATPSGEELAVAVDEKLRAAMRGDRPRLGQLEIEMESSLTPREIQTRIRSGETLDDVARVAGIPMDRVERFAAPVLAEREHVAAVAMTSSVRRRGETSGHRNLRVAVTERLHARGVDVDSLVWDSYRREDGRWTVTAGYLSGEAQHKASFLFDQQGRFSVAADDEARWLLGEPSAAHGPQPGRRRAAPGADDPADTEPTLDLSDELALVRVVQEEPEQPLATVRALRPQVLPPVADEPTAAATGDEVDHDADDAADAAVVTDSEADKSVESFDAGEVAADAEPERAEEPALVAEPVGAETADLDAEDPADEDEAEGSQLDALYEMLGGVGYAEDSSTAYAGLDELPSLSERPPAEDDFASDEFVDEVSPDGLTGTPAAPAGRSGPGSDAIAIPDVSTAGWEPAIVVNYPVEPSQLDDAELPIDGPGRPEPPVALADREDEAEELLDEAADHPSLDPVAPEPPAEPDSAAENEPQPSAPEATRPIARRKRASVPSWDEIMFGGPKRG